MISSIDRFEDAAPPRLAVQLRHAQGWSCRSTRTTKGIVSALSGILLGVTLPKLRAEIFQLHPSCIGFSTKICP